MIQCKYKEPYQVTNRGLDTAMCGLLGKSVNDDICSNCEFREGKTRRELVVLDILNFPKRSDKEIEIIYEVCNGCEHHHPVNKTCKKMKAEFHPTDIVAQNPGNHCPIDKW